MASRRADWVLGEARLTSSARTMLAKMPPGRNSNSLVPRFHTDTPGHVGRQQVGGELDAVPGAVDRPGDGLGQHRLAHAGHVLDQQVPVGHQAGQRHLDDLALALDDPLDVADEGVELLLERRRAERRPACHGLLPQGVDN